MSFHTPWLDLKIPERYPALREPETADVIIIGGGMAGLLTAYFLGSRGKSVIVLEKDRIGHGVTSLTTAFLTESLDTNFTTLIQIFGLRTARKIVRSHHDAIDEYEKIISRHNLRADFRRISNFIYALTPKERHFLSREKEALEALGGTASLHKHNTHLGFKAEGYIEIPNQGVLHPTKFLYELAGKALPERVTIHEKTEVLDVAKRSQLFTVRTKSATLKAPWVISTTYSPFEEPLRLYFKKGMYVSYVIEAFSKNPNLIEGIFEDTENPYHYLRIEKEGTGFRIIAGGEDHRKDIPVKESKNFEALEEYLDSLFPGHDYEIRSKWKGPILEPIDGLALIGPIKTPHLLYATAFSGTGMTYSMIAAQLLTDYVTKKKNPLHEIYAANRIPRLKALLKKGVDYSEELVGGAVKNTLTQ